MEECPVLSAIEAALKAPSSRAFVQPLESQYQLREGPERRSRLAFALRVIAICLLAALALDLADNRLARFLLFASCRVAIAALCLVGARLIVRAKRPWQEALAYAVPAIGVMLVTELLGQLSRGPAADRYMIAAAVCGLAMLSAPPISLATGRIITVAGVLLFPIVPILVPGRLPLDENWDLPIFACGTFSLGLLLVRRNIVRARVAFLQTVRLEILAERLTRLNAELLSASTTDWLTNLPNRRSFDRELRALSQNGSTQGFGLALIDVDHFKAFNDTAGHDAGDTCLRDVAASISGVLRAGERAARYGGEEFTVLISCLQDDMAALGERLRSAVEQAAIPHPGKGGAPLTISVGLAWRRRNAPGPVSDLVRQADQALYQAKCAGRNRAVMASNNVHKHEAA